MTDISIKNKHALIKMRTAGKLLAEIMEKIGSEVVVGVGTLELNDRIEQEMRKVGLIPECKGYAGYPYATCISLNDVVVHGMPSKKVILKSGDFVKIDVVASYKQYCVDMARFFFVGDVSDSVKALAITAQEALDAAIKSIEPGICVSDISAKVQEIVEKKGFGVVRRFAGHGIGKQIHEAPDVPNYGKPGQGARLQPGMTLAIEPMITQGSYDVKIMDDGWTARTADGGFAAHVEDTVLVTNDGVEVLTRLS